MTNRERLIETLKDPEHFLEVVHHITNIGDSYFNWRKWLKSDDPKPLWRGDKAYYREYNGDLLPCILVKKKKMYGENYYKIYIPNGKDILDPEFDLRKATVPQDTIQFDE